MSQYRWQFLLVAPAGWINRQQQDVIAYLEEESARFPQLGAFRLPGRSPAWLGLMPHEKVGNGETYRGRSGR